MTECRQCGQWIIKNTDDYCSYCGFLQLPISIEPLKLTLISEIAPEGKITFKNDDAKDLEIKILPSNHSFDWVTFLASNSFTLPGEDSTEVKVRLNEEKLPKELGVKELKFVCMVDEDQRKTFDLSIYIKAGPYPIALSDEIRFGDVEEGKDIESWVEIFNKGGVPLQFKNIVIEGSDQFQVKSKKALELLNPNEKIMIPLIWKSPKYDPNLEPNSMGLKIQFKNTSKELFIPIKEKLICHGLSVEPHKIRIEEAFLKQTYSRQITLINNGTKDVEITAIESDHTWIQIVSRVNTFTLLGKKSISCKLATGPTVFSGHYTFEVVLLPRESPKYKAGLHKGKVIVRTLEEDVRLEIEIQLFIIQPRVCNEYIGIDFGNKNSVMAIFDDETCDIRLLEEENSATKERSPLIPSVLVFKDRRDNYVIGREAEALADIYPEMTVRSIKRNIGYNNDRTFFGENFSPEDLAALFIKKLIEYAEVQLFKIKKNRDHAYLDINKAIFTVPASFYDLQIRGMLSACEKAGIDTEEEQAIPSAIQMKEEVEYDFNVGILLDEPSAAALFYLSKFNEEGKFDNEFNDKFSKNEEIHFLLFGHGEGTLDASVVRIVKLKDKNIGIEILANKGDSTIDGDGIDIVIMKKLLKICKSQEKFKDFDDTLIGSNFNELKIKHQKENWSRAVWADVLRARANWKRAAEKLKIDLDNKMKTDFSLNESGIDILSMRNRRINYLKEEFRIEVNRDMLKGWIKEILDKCQLVVREVLSFAAIKAEKIDYIIHTGSLSLRPQVREAVKNLFPHIHEKNDILDKENLNVCFAKGAALYGLIRTGIAGRQQVRLLRSRRLPYSYGRQILRGFKPLFEPIIEMGREYPTTEIIHFDESEIPKRGILHLKFLQNSGWNNKIAKNPDIRVIGSITIDTLADNKPGCDIKITIDANRKLEVTADGRPVKIELAKFESEEGWL